MIPFKVSSLFITMFKLLLFVICLIGSSLADGPEIEKAYKTCAPNFPSVDSQVLDKFCEASYQTTDKDTKCLMKCVGEGTGYATADGKIIVSKFKASASPLVDQAKLEAALTKCFEMVKPDPCDTAYDQWKCLCAVDKA